MNDIRKGMWVKYRGKIGIVASMDKTAAMAELHLVDDKGQTTLVMPAVAFTSLKQAGLENIPAPRRPTAARAEKFGYV